MARTISFPTAPTACRAATAIIMMLRAGKGKRGFSLLELVLVLLLIGVSMLIVLPNIARGLQEREVRTSALGLAAAARDLRSRALFDGEAQQLVVNLPQNSYRVAPLQRSALAGGGKVHFRRRRRGRRSRQQEILLLPER